MTLKSWDQLPLQLKRNVRKLYEHLQDNTDDALDDWEDLDVITKRSKVNLYNEVATKLEGFPSWKQLPYKHKLSRKLRWTMIYDSLVDDDHTVTVTVKDGDDALPGATVTIGSKSETTGANGVAVFEELDDGEISIEVSKTYYTTKTETKTVDRKHTNFTISLVHEKRNLSITVNTGTEDPTPVEGASVAIGDITGTTGAAGGCTLSNVLDGEHTITATATGYENYSATITSDSTHSSFTITMTAVTPVDDDENTGGE